MDELSNNQVRHAKLSIFAVERSGARKHSDPVSCIEVCLHVVFRVMPSHSFLNRCGTRMRIPQAIAVSSPLRAEVCQNLWDGGVAEICGASCCAPGMRGDHIGVCMLDR
jgi:hypothetical protein